MDTNSSSNDTNASYIAAIIILFLFLLTILGWYDLRFDEIIIETYIWHIKF